MYYLGIDIGGTNIKAGIVNEAGEILYRETIPTGGMRASEEIASDIGRLAARLQKEADGETIRSCGIGIPGACEDKSGTVLYTANINFKNFPLREVVEREIGIPVHLGNDANCAALGEFHMLPEKIENMVLVTLGTGIGGGLILGGKLYTGFNGIAGEVGHSLIVRDGEMCGCGRRGCWEAYGSITALIRQTKAYAMRHPESAVAEACGKDFLDVSGKTAFELSKNGDVGGQEIVEEWISYVAEGLIDLINIFQPELLLIGGAISREGETLLGPLRQKVRAGMYKSEVPETGLRAAALGNDAGLIGAAFLGK